MPHITIEFTENLRKEGKILELLKKVNNSFIEMNDTFPIGGIRSRAIGLTDYVIADGTGQADAFVHVIVKIGTGRSEHIKKLLGEKLFTIITNHFESIFPTRPLALSMELNELPIFTYRKNNIHQRYKKS
ncbi:5-carboxymethyl-2-hydroxymuconate Delta-isomerase [Virgibacillus soli]|uniref:5-carboxymethyl-2-hydroxymuconate Delta-isomerase n=1 Tax=Paracerasibacillus soli TaxID=480284 RepID=A0ABU5CSZ0_9BACI|nr:5-carboxymethyl-2-hydroxymuconate Delta-isomerase [Virgibacillus soli]MDY0408957.1 5-carboxymethyl-2-hydroxymuconate Delta-isomerase [Virgibacillus soli]